MDIRGAPVREGGAVNPPGQTLESTLVFPEGGLIYVESLCKLWFILPSRWLFGCGYP